VIGVDPLVVPRTFVGPVGFDRIGSVTRHRHVFVLPLCRPGSSRRLVRVPRLRWTEPKSPDRPASMTFFQRTPPE
jgi:hypothetical protein